MRKNAKTLKQVELSHLQGYHATTFDRNGELYAYDGFKTRKYFTNDRSIELDENYNRADGKPLKGYGLEIETECFGVCDRTVYAEILDKIIFSHFPKDLFKLQRDGSLGGDTSAECITRAIERENFTDEDTVIYHFRISTQAGICAEMTHPFPLTTDITKTRALDIECAVGVAHNGIIKLTSDSADKIYNDTAHFVSKFMTKIIRNRADFNSEATKKIIEELTHSKWAIINKYGDLMTVGNFIESDGNLYSNLSFMNYYQYSFRF